MILMLPIWLLFCTVVTGLALWTAYFMAQAVARLLVGRDSAVLKSLWPGAVLGGFLGSLSTFAYFSKACCFPLNYPAHWGPWVLKSLGGDEYNFMLFCPINIVSYAGLCAMIGMLFQVPWKPPCLTLRCSGCNYDLRAASSDVCPECGKSIAPVLMQMWEAEGQASDSAENDES
jgi:hypothetical protein